MRKFLFVMVAFITIFMTSAEARHVRIKVPAHIPKVATLPDSSYYKTEEGTHLDLGYIEKDGNRVLVLFSESKPDTYYDIPDDYVAAIQEDLNVEELSSLIPEPTFWDKWGGSILLYGFGVFVVIGIISYLKDFIFGFLGLGKKQRKITDEEDNDKDVKAND